MLTSIMNRGLKLAKHLPGFPKVARRFTSSHITILMYHGVTLDQSPVFDWCQVAAAAFEKQIRYLSEEYTVLPLIELVQRLREHLPLPQRAAAVTFDDGLRNVYSTAYPILERFQVPSTIFLVTSLVGTNQPPWPARILDAVARSPRPSISFRGMEWPLLGPQSRQDAAGALVRSLKSMDNDTKEDLLKQMLADLGIAENDPPSPTSSTMNWEEVRKLRSGGLVTFGSHTHTHPILSCCSLQVQQEELSTSRDILRDQLGEVSLFAYPNGDAGDYTRSTKRLLVELGYSSALTTEHRLTRPEEDLFEIPRVGIGADDTFSRFQLRILGW